MYWCKQKKINATQYVYDQRNLQIQIIFADSKDAADKIVFLFDFIQRKTFQTDQAGVTISYQFDFYKGFFSQRHKDHKEFKKGE